MKNKPVRFLTATLILGACVLIGCSPKQEKTDSTSGNAPTQNPNQGGAITIGYSDWPGWTCWDIAEKQGFFKKHNVNVKLVWFPTYTDSLNALAAGQVDANCQTWIDTMGPLAQGQALKAVLVNDNSAGNDAIVAGAGIHSVKELRGKKVATELGTVEQFLLDKALVLNGMTEKDIQYVNIKVQDCPGAMIAGKIDACAIWEPNKSQLLDNLPGTHVIFDSKQIPGLIADLLVFQAKTVKANPKEIQGVVDAWYDMMAYWRAHPDEAVKIMAQRTNSKPEVYARFITGTRIFNAAEAQAALTQTAKTTSLYTSGKEVAQFLLDQKQIPKLPDYAAAIDPSFVTDAASRGEGKQTPYEYTLKVD
jgi:NitT/TauT family transport system substrate-binding protein